MEQIVEVRNKLKSKKPDFIRHDAHKKSRISKAWRKPKGRQNKMRLAKKGYRRGVSIGFGSPVLARGLSRDGLKQVLVYTIKNLESINPKKDGVIIGKSVGNKSRMEIINACEKSKIKILNLNLKLFKEKFDLTEKLRKEKKEMLSKRKSEKEKQEKKLKEKKEETKSTPEDQKEKSDEEKISIKKEQDKILTKKDQPI